MPATSTLSAAAPTRATAHHREAEPMATRFSRRHSSGRSWPARGCYYAGHGEQRQTGEKEDRASPAGTVLPGGRCAARPPGGPGDDSTKWARATEASPEVSASFMRSAAHCSRDTRGRYANPRPAFSRSSSPLLVQPDEDGHRGRVGELALPAQPFLTSSPGSPGRQRSTLTSITWLLEPPPPSRVTGPQVPRSLVGGRVAPSGGGGGYAARPADGRVSGLRDPGTSGDRCRDCCRGCRGTSTEGTSARSNICGPPHARATARSGGGTPQTRRTARRRQPHRWVEGTRTTPPHRQGRAGGAFSPGKHSRYRRSYWSREG